MDEESQKFRDYVLEGELLFSAGYILGATGDKERVNKMLSVLKFVNKGRFYPEIDKEDDSAQ